LFCNYIPSQSIFKFEETWQHRFNLFILFLYFCFVVVVVCSAIKQVEVSLVNKCYKPLGSTHCPSNKRPVWLVATLTSFFKLRVLLSNTYLGSGNVQNETILAVLGPERMCEEHQPNWVLNAHVRQIRGDEDVRPWIRLLWRLQKITRININEWILFIENNN